MPAEDYTCIRLLGKGSFGRVFLVRHIRENSLWVMKEIELGLAQATPDPGVDPDKAKNDALREVAMLSRLDHPNIVKYRECFQTTSPITQSLNQPLNQSTASNQAVNGQSIMYIIMEYCDSGDLNGKIKQQKKSFSEDQILAWFVQLCLAVKHLHDRKCLHRDLKGENVFLASAMSQINAQQAGNNASIERIKLGDFGISKVLPSTFACALTRIGTPYYLSPEICMNKPYNTASDMWSLGVCLYELCMLSHPFDASSMESLLKKIVRVPHRPIHPFFHADLRSLVDSLMNKNPLKRPTIHEVLRIPILQREVSKWLTKSEFEREFLILPTHVLKDATPPNRLTHSRNQSGNQPMTDSVDSTHSTVICNNYHANNAPISQSPSNNQAAAGKKADDTRAWLKAAEDKMRAAEEKRRQALQTGNNQSNSQSKQNRAVANMVITPFRGNNQAQNPPNNPPQNPPMNQFQLYNPQNPHFNNPSNNDSLTPNSDSAAQYPVSNSNVSVFREANYGPRFAAPPVAAINHFINQPNHPPINQSINQPNPPNNPAVYAPPSRLNHQSLAQAMAALQKEREKEETKQSNNQSSHSSINQSVRSRSNNQSQNHSTNGSPRQPTFRPNNQYGQNHFNYQTNQTSLPTSPGNKHSNNQSNQSTNQSMSTSVSNPPSPGRMIRTIVKPVVPIFSIDRSINPAIEQDPVIRKLRA